MVQWDVAFVDQVDFGVVETYFTVAELSVDILRRVSATDGKSTGLFVFTAVMNDLDSFFGKLFLVVVFNNVHGWSVILYRTSCGRRCWLIFSGFVDLRSLFCRVPA